MWMCRRGIGVQVATPPYYLPLRQSTKRITYYFCHRANEFASSIKSAQEPK